MESYKVIVCGKPCGKSPQVRRLLGFELDQSQTEVRLRQKAQGHTLGVEVHPYTTEGKTFDIWDCGGYYQGLRDGYYIGADIAFIYADSEQERNDFSSGLPQDCLKIYHHNPQQNFTKEALLQASLQIQ